MDYQELLFVNRSFTEAGRYVNKGGLVIELNLIKFSEINNIDEIMNQLLINHYQSNTGIVGFDD